MTRKQRNRRNKQQLHPVSETVDLTKLRARLKASDPTFPGRGGVITSVGVRFGAKELTILLDAKAPSSSRPVCRRLLCDVMLLERWERRPSAPQRERDTNVW